jgi:curved DNA-binding protein CbpA
MCTLAGALTLSAWFVTRSLQLAEHRFRVVADAYETLRNPETRAKHDQDHFFRPSRS